MPRVTFQEVLKSVIENGTDSVYYLERQSLALPLPEATELNPSYLVPAPYFPNPLSFFQPFPSPRNSCLYLTPSQTPNYVPQSRRLQLAGSPLELVPDQKKMAKENSKIFENLILQLIDLMKHKKKEAKHLGYKFSARKTKGSPRDAHQLFKWMKELAGQPGGFRHAEMVKITNAVFEARLATHHTFYDTILRDTNIFASAFVHFAGPDMLDCPSVMQYATEYMNEANPKIALIDADKLP